MIASDRRPLVVVLGASGYLGSAVAALLARQQIRLRLISRRAGRPPANPVAEIEQRTVDLMEPGVLAASVAGAHVIVHLVARIDGGASWRGADADPEIERVNVGLVGELVEVVRNGHTGRCPVVLFAGTVASVGLPERIRIDGSEPDAPRSAYPRQKLAAERMLNAATAEGLLRAVTLRLPTLFGPGPASATSDKGVVNAMVRRALEGYPLTLWDRTVLRDMVHVDDVARAMTAAIEHADELAGKHWLIGTGQSRPLGEIFTSISTTVAAVTGSPPVPVKLVDPPGQVEATDLRGVEIDSSAFRRVTGWRPEVVREQGLSALAVAMAERVAAGAG